MIILTIEPITIGTIGRDIITINKVIKKLELTETVFRKTIKVGTNKIIIVKKVLK